MNYLNILDCAAHVFSKKTSPSFLFFLSFYLYRSSSASDHIVGNRTKQSDLCLRQFLLVFLFFVAIENNARYV